MIFYAELFVIVLSWASLQTKTATEVFVANREILLAQQILVFEIKIYNAPCYSR